MPSEPIHSVSLLVYRLRLCTSTPTIAVQTHEGTIGMNTWQVHIFDVQFMVSSVENNETFVDKRAFIRAFTNLSSSRTLSVKLCGFTITVLLAPLGYIRAITPELDT